jgi:hypothetical protein
LETCGSFYDENSRSKTTDLDTFDPVLPCLITKDLKYASSPKLPSIARKSLKNCENRRILRLNAFDLSGWETANEDLKAVMDFY